MVTIHHLGISQSDRVVWMMEELEQPYHLKWYNRGEDFLAPPEYLELHPVGTAPVIEDGDVVMAESTAIVEYLSHRHGGGCLSVAQEDEDYPHYLYWMQFNNNFQSVLFMKMAYQAGGGDLSAGGQIVDVMQRRENGLYSYLEQRLGDSDYLGAGRFTCADIMVAFNLTSLEMLGARPIDASLPNTCAYLGRIKGRAAYQKAMAIAGPEAAQPAS